MKTTKKKKKKFYWPATGMTLECFAYWGLAALLAAVLISGGWGLFLRLHG